MKKVLVACEFSQIVMTAFLEAGADAYSCDIIPSEGNYPERHFQMDALDCIKSQNWDLVIAHPPCTYLSNVTAPLIIKNGTINIERYNKMLEAKRFFLSFFEDYKGKLCVENPRPLTMANLPNYTQIVNPANFGSCYHKLICLWLRDLPPLLGYIDKNIYSKSWHYSHKGSHMRSRFFPEVAKAMAEQWYPIL